MKIWLFSDLHLEFSSMPKDFEVPKADLCIAAGDIHTKGGARSLQWLNEVIAPSMEVLFVPGNHEYYDKSIVSGLALMKETLASTPRIHLLDKVSKRYDDIEFIGATLWTDYNLHGNAELASYASRDKSTGMNDFKYIKYQSNPWIRFTPYRAATIFRESLSFIENALEQSAASKKVVITHHAPSARSLAPDKLTDILSASYASNLDAFIERTSPNLWIHGHIHHSNDYMVGRTRVLSNPRGYIPKQPNKDFDPAMIIDI